jgi:hypothetical protein
MTANVCLAIIIFVSTVAVGSAIFGIVDYIRTQNWIEEQEKYLREMENKRA